MDRFAAILDADDWFPDLIDDLTTSFGFGESYPVVEDEDEARALTDGGAPVRVWIRDGDGSTIPACKPSSRHC